MVFNKTPIKIIDNVTVTASGYATSSGIDLGAAYDFCIGYQLTFNAAATLGAEIRAYADPTGNTQDFTINTYNNYYDLGTINVNAGNTVEGVLILQRSPRYIKIRVYNLDTNQTITACNLWSQIQAP